MFGTFSMAGFMYIYFYVPETKGLSEQEKHEIFWPGARYGRKLDEYEECNVGYEHRSDITIQNEAFKLAISLMGSSDRGGFGS